jgi:hypothetical protein
LEEAAPLEKRLADLAMRSDGAVVDWGYEQTLVDMMLISGRAP